MRLPDLRGLRFRPGTLVALVLVLLGVFTVQVVRAQTPTLPPVFPSDRPPPPRCLKSAKVPLPENLGDYITDKQAAIVLGKALFWDQQAGSDGLACASCHFDAGADNRVKNQLDPGLRNELGAPVSEKFDLTASNKRLTSVPAGGGPNYTLK